MSRKEATVLPPLHPTPVLEKSKAIDALKKIHPPRPLPMPSI